MPEVVPRKSVLERFWNRPWTRFFRGLPLGDVSRKIELWLSLTYSLEGHLPLTTLEYRVSDRSKEWGGRATEEREKSSLLDFSNDEGAGAPTRIAAAEMVKFYRYKGVRAIDGAWRRKKLPAAPAVGGAVYLTTNVEAQIWAKIDNFSTKNRHFWLKKKRICGKIWRPWNLGAQRGLKFQDHQIFTAYPFLKFAKARKSRENPLKMIKFAHFGSNLTQF